ncbi:hypothetical protein Tco_1533344 [Tanacetum coccineum]
MDEGSSYSKRDWRSFSLKIKLDEDLRGKPVDATLYRGIIGSLMYLTSSRPDLIYAAYAVATMRPVSGTRSYYIRESAQFLRIMSSITAQQAKLDLELVPKEKRLEIGKCNGRLNPKKT